MSRDLLQLVSSGAYLDHVAVGQGFPRGLTAGERIALLLHLPLDRREVHPRQSDEHHLAVGAVFGLRGKRQGKDTEVGPLHQP